MTDYTVYLSSMGNLVTVTATAYVEHEDMSVDIKAYVNNGSTSVRIAPSAISGNSVSLYNRNMGTDGATGILPPYTLTFQPKAGTNAGTIYRVNVYD